MVLNRKDGEFPVPEALVRVIVQVEMSDLEFHGIERVRIDGEAVILRRDLECAGQKVFDRVVATAMAELEFEGLAPECQSEQLVPETDPENRLPPEQCFDILDGDAYRGRVAGTVREEDPVRIHRENVFSGKTDRNDCHRTTVLDESSKNVSLDAVVIRYHG